MEKLPLEITANILRRLPMVFKLQSREVCKTWHTLVPKPKKGLLYGVRHRKIVELQVQFYFSEQHYDRNVGTKLVDDGDEQLTKLDHSLIMSPSRYDRFMVGSCSGLVCCVSIVDDGSFATEVSICNPVTGKQRQLPIIERDGRDLSAGWSIGFGYSRSSGECKVVRILHGYEDHWDLNLAQTVQVYTLQGGAVWRKIKSNNISNCFKPSSCGGLSIPSVGVFAGRALYWLDMDRSDQYDRNPPTVVAFDLEHETFEMLPSIPYVVYEANAGLMVLGGNLCVLDIVTFKHVTIWEYRKTQKRCCYVSPWHLKFSIAWKEGSLFEPVGLTNNDRYLLWYNVILSCYDPDDETKTSRKLDETLKKIKENRRPSIYSPTQAIPFMHCVDSLEAEERDWKEMKNSKGDRKRKFYCY